MRQSKLILFAFLLIVGCTKEKRDAVTSNALMNPPGSPSFAALQSDIFLLSCAVSGCHDNRATPAGQLNLSSYDKSYAELVNITSVQVPSRKLVVAADPSLSYLINKLQGTHTAVGGTGVRMPQFAAALPPSEIDRVVTWINNGALKD